MLCVLGETRVGGTPLRFRSRRTEALLGLLATHTEAGLPRAEAAARLWPDLPPDRALHNLRQNLVYLREALGSAGVEDALGAGRDRIAYKAPVDVREFALAIQTGGADGLQAARAFDTGPLLPGIDGEWAEDARRQHESVRLEGLLALARIERERDPGAALALARLAVAADPMLEAARREEILALHAAEEPGLAREAFTAYDRYLRREVGFEASGRLRSLAYAETEAPLAPEHAELSPAERLALAVARAPIHEFESTLESGRAALMSALNAAESAPRDLRATAWATIARLTFALGEWPLAAEQAREAERTAQGAGALVLARAMLARTLAWTGEIPEAIAIAETAVRGAKARGDLEAGVEALMAWGGACWQQGRWAESRRLYARALRWARRAGSPSLRFRAAHSLGSLRFAIEGPRAGLQTLEELIAEEGFRASPDQWTMLQADLGRSHEGLGDLVSARRAYEIALSASRSPFSPQKHAQSLTYLADLDLREGEIESARRGHEAAVAIRRTLGDRLGLATSLRGLGKSRLAGGDARGAKAAHREAVSLIGPETNGPTVASFRFPLAWALLALDERTEAARQFEIGAAALAGIEETVRAALVSDRSIDSLAETTLRKALDASP